MIVYDLVQFGLFVFLVFLCNYIIHVVTDSRKQQQVIVQAEGFTDASSEVAKLDSDYTWIHDPQLIYDTFYAGVYDQLCKQSSRVKAKLAILHTLWKQEAPVKDWAVLDAGCGTGHTSVSLCQLGAGRVVGLDYAPAMLKQAKEVVLPEANLTEDQAHALVWRQDSLVNPTACSAGEFTHIVCFYFTYYYMQDQEMLFRHFHLWAKPGAKLCIEVVNKYKFDPILESASPFVAFSLQKYSKDRIRKSKVIFDKFEYEAEFVLTDPKAEFYETFRFKNDHVRRQKHTFYMPTIEKVVELGKRSGWKYIGYHDLNSVGFEYAYLLTFEKN